MKPVFICSPYSGPTPAAIQANVQYARNCMLNSIDRGEAPYVPHLLYTQVLDDNAAAHRQYGTDAALRYLDLIKFLAVYTDFGLSRGMEREIRHARDFGYQIEYRRLTYNFVNP